MHSRDQEPQISSSVFLSIYSELGAGRDVFDRGLREFGITLDDMRDLDGHISLRRYVQLFEWLAVELDDPWLGLRLSHQVGPHALGALGYLFLCSTSLEIAFQSVSTYLEANQTSSRLDIEILDDLVHIRYRIIDDKIGPRRQDSEYSTGITWRYMKLLSHNKCRLTQVRFEHERPERQTQLYRRLFSAPVLFAQKSNDLILPLTDYRQSHRGMDPNLFPILEKYIASSVDQLKPPGTFAECIEQLLTEQVLSQGARASLIADKLQVSKVTLHRRLHDEGVRFKNLVEQRSKDLAERHLRYSNLPISTISRRLGFRNAATFSRAFRRWYSTTPSEFRRSIKQERLIEYKQRALRGAQRS